MVQEKNLSSIFILIRSLNVGGAERQVSVLAKALHNKGYKVTVGVFYSGGGLEEDLRQAGVSLYSLHKKSRWDIIGWFGRYLRAIRDVNPDVIYSFLTVSNIVAIIGRLFIPKPVVWGIRASNMNLKDYDWLASLTGWVEKKLSRYVQTIIFNANVSRQYHESLGYHLNNAVVIPNGIDTDRFKPDVDSKVKTRHQLGIPQDAFVVGMLARVDPMKDYKTYLAAAHALSSGHKNLYFIAAGAGTDTAPWHPLPPRFLGVGVWKDVSQLLNALDVMVLSSAFGEGFPNVVGEAMACGIPAIVTDVGDAPYVVGDQGIVIPPQNGEALTHAIESLLQHHDFSKDTIRHRILSHFSVPHMVDQTLHTLTKAYIPILDEKHMFLNRDLGRSFSFANLRFIPCLSFERANYRRRDRVENPTQSHAQNSSLFIENGYIPSMKIAHLITGLGIGGAERQLTALVTNQDTSCLSQKVISLKDEGVMGQYLSDGGAGKPCCLNLHKSPSGLWRFYRMLRREKPDVLQTWLYHADLVGLMIGKLARVPHIVWNIRCSNMDLSRYSRMTSWVLRILTVLSRFPDGIVTNSQAGQAFHVKLGYKPRRWVHIPNGIDTDLFQPNKDLGDTLRASCQIPKEAIVVGMLGRVDPMKDHVTFLTAMERLSRTHENLYCMIAGKDTTSVCWPVVPSRLLRLGVWEDVPSFLNALDIMVLSSLSEGFPNVVGEAMACGVPTIVTDVGDAALLVQTKAQIVPPQDVDCLARALKGLLALSAEDRKALGQQGRQRILTAYSLPIMKEKYVSFYNSLK